VEQLIRPCTDRPASNWELSWGGLMHMVLSREVAGSTRLPHLVTLKMAFLCSLVGDVQHPEVLSSWLYLLLDFLSVGPCLESQPIGAGATIWQMQDGSSQRNQGPKQSTANNCLRSLVTTRVQPGHNFRSPTHTSRKLRSYLQLRQSRATMRIHR
jgi:hypothetical protein